MDGWKNKPYIKKKHFYENNLLRINCKNNLVHGHKNKMSDNKILVTGEYFRMQNFKTKFSALKHYVDINCVDWDR